CVQGCPVKVDIPKFISHIVKGKFDKAAKSIKNTNNLPGVCGRVCPQESQCEKLCILNRKSEPVSIGRLERFAADHEETVYAPLIKRNKKKVAVIGAGPSGLTAAADLAIMGYQVTVYEALQEAGGVLKYGIPEFRLPNKIVDKEIEYIKKLGVEIKTNQVVGRIISIDELQEKYDAIFVSSGAGLPHFMKIPGENLPSVYSANEFLTRINLMKAYEFPRHDTPVKRAIKTVVVGGGNVAMDAARCAKRLGSEVTIVYRRSFEEMPARKEEIKHAQEEGIHFLLLTSPIRILGDSKVEGIECIQMRLGDEDTSGRRQPVPIENSEFVIACDQVIIAIGSSPNPLALKETAVDHNPAGYLFVNENLMTSKEGVFAGGDIIGGTTGHGATVIQAMGDGKTAAKAIDTYLKQRKLEEFK
ncbi:MAG: NADPH-dependent glutamate synthase, partial [Nanoarchaeota archaeon]|nr:NADPH-dependent glutamate synthase [Nanoarchaeota archaeon]